MEEEAIYIKRPSRQRHLAFGFLTLTSLAIVGGVWFYLMKNVIVDAASDARTQAQEYTQVMEEYRQQQEFTEDLSGIFQELDQIIKPLAETVSIQPNPALLEAATGVIKEQVISGSGQSATSDLSP
ncbi:hypothetical protein KJ611_01125 [Patescibacteria group bacterium]|nr:hypothetical protein [Patescibacteria group bacterium]MBU1705287.1 hypothetical protein [Patescibacteria group bacterium]